MYRFAIRTLFAPLAVGFAAMGLCGSASGQAMPEPSTPAHRQLAPNRAPLAPTAFVRLPIGSVRPEGWLHNQLELQKEGLTGSAEEMYEALTPNSAWLGGNGEAWEKGPYYVKGLIALAHTLDDESLKQKAQKWIDWALQSQRPDGFFGPSSNDDWWPRMVVLFYLRDHYEATGDERVIPFFLKYFRHQLEHLPNRPLRDWGRARAGDNIDVVLWTYNRTGEPFLLDLARLLHQQAYPWTSIYSDNRFYDFGSDFHPQHIVNVSQALKMPAVAWQFTKNDADRNAIARGLEHLDRQYGRIDGQISGTEMLSGRRSTDGVELCADIERIISNAIAMAILGDAELGDQLEKVAYNSLPAHTSARMQQITYYQLINQVACTFGGHGFAQDYGNGNVPGPHSGFPCCCYNWHAGWPKFVESMWAATSDGGLAALTYGPNRVTTSIAGDIPITITQDTEYPFKDTITLRIDPQRSARFPLLLRVPGWCTEASISVNGEPAETAAAGTFHRLEREWKSGDVVELRFPMAVRASRWINDSIGLERGPLAFGLKIDEQWRKARDYLGEFDEFEVLPQSPWNYALQTDDAAAGVEVQVNDVSAVPFATDAPPVVLKVQARQVPQWTMRQLPGRVVLGRADGQWHALADASTALAAGEPQRLRVEARGSRLRVFINDKQVIDHTDDRIASGGVGLRTYQAGARFDDIVVNSRRVEDFERDSDAWQTFGGEWSVRDGQFAAQSGARDGKAVLKGVEGLKDLTLEATVTVDAGGDAGVMFRVSNATDRLDGYHGYYVGLAAAAGKSEDADEPPASPVVSDQPLETVQLIPFGSSKLRVCYFPVLRQD